MFRLNNSRFEKICRIYHLSGPSCGYALLLIKGAARKKLKEKLQKFPRIKAR